MTEERSINELEGRISELQSQMRAVLAPYEVETAVGHWLDTLRGIEELINLPTVDWSDEPFERQLYALPVVQLTQHMPLFMGIRKRLLEQFSEPFVNRFSNLIFQGSAIATSLAAHGLAEAASGFQTLGSMIGYLQSRRRHFVGLLHFMPIACRGSSPVGQLDTLNIFLPLIELLAIPMMGAQYALMVTLAQAHLGIGEDASAELAMLNSLFLEPERVSIVEMPMSDEGMQILKGKELLPPNKLFSAAELRNDILLIEAAYAEFDLRGTDFATAALLVRRLSMEYIERDYWIQISPEDLANLAAHVGASRALTAAFTCGADNYMKCLSSYAPLVLVGDHYLSTVTLLSRFMYFWRARILDRKKRFQIRAGFIFEEQVKLALEKQGFVVQNIVRINRQEFDVVSLREGTIWNVQCKNNFIELESVDSDVIAFARYNRGLVRSYERALVKERNREHLLKSKLAIDSIQHMVVSRFPVVTNNPRIVVFSRIADFAKRADAVLASFGSSAVPASSLPSPLLIRTKFTDALTKVERVIDALKTQGIECSSSSSLGSLFAKLRHLNKQYARDPSGYKQRTFLASIEALWIAEALEIAIGEPGSREAIHRIVTSNMSLSERQDSHGKNALWELDLYRRLKLGGATVWLDEPDLVLELGNGLGKFGVACKKVYSESGVRDALEDGCGQLRKQGLPGAVAFNLDDLMEEKVRLRAPTTEALHKVLVSRGKKFVTDHGAVLKKMIDRQQCDGVLISISIVSEVPDEPVPITLARVPMVYGYLGQLSASAKKRLEVFQQWIDRVASQR